MFSVKIQVVEAQIDLVLSALEKINSFIDGNAVNPRKKAGVPFEIFKGFIGLDESFLSEVVRVLVIGRHVVNGGVNAFLVPPDQVVERRVITFLRSLDKDPVFNGYGLRLLADY
jgi:hypothetical protein